ncbi:MAG: type II toxin-antitoxin system VapC family toxin [Gammaproteobacteria bacterium]
MLVYLDTSALAKWYLNEPGSESFSEWIRSQQDTHISTLTGLELRCLLARRKRAGELSTVIAQQVFATFQGDVERGYLIRHDMHDEQFVSATHLLDRLTPIALRTLDALHLGVAHGIGAECLATADRIMAQAGRALGLTIFQPT